MCGTTARAQRNTPFRLTLITASNCSSLMIPATAPSLYFTSCPSRRMPALLTSTLTVPHRATTSRTAASTATELPVSTFWKMPPSSAAPSFTSHDATRHPSWAKRRAVAFPIPAAPPVTTTTLLRNPVSIMCVCSCQKLNFNANCITRGPVAVDVMVPSVSGTSTLLFGFAKFTRLNALKNSDRNSSLVFSCTGMNFTIDRSTFLWSGRRKSRLVEKSAQPALRRSAPGWIRRRNQIRPVVKRRPRNAHYRERRTRLQCCDAAHLPVVHDACRQRRFASVELRQVIGAAQHEPVLAVVVRDPPIRCPVLLIPRHRGEFVGRRARRIVDRLRECVRRQERQPFAEPFCQAGLQRIIERVRIGRCYLKAVQRLVIRERRRAVGSGRRRRPLVQRVHIDQLRAFRPYVADLRHPVLVDFPLHAQAVLLYVRRAEVRAHINTADRRRRRTQRHSREVVRHR